MFCSSLNLPAVPNYFAVPYTMTAEAISWRTRYPEDTDVIAIEQFYSDAECGKYIDRANQNRYA